MNKVLNILSYTALFGGLPKDQLEKIGRIARNRFYSRGEIIFEEGDDGIGFYIVVIGTVKIFKASSDGKEQILHIFGPGEPFGEVPVFSGQPFPANAQAIAKTHLLFFPKPRLWI